MSSILIDTTSVATEKAVAGASTGNVVLATFTDTIPQSGLITEFSVPGATSTNATAVSGNQVVGYYVSGGHAFGFLYNSSTAAFTTLAPPGTSSTSANGLTGNYVVGFYSDSSNVNHGYLYNTATATYTTFDPPGSVNTFVTAASGNDVVGYYVSGGRAYGFAYNIQTATFLTLAPPGTSSTLANGATPSYIAGYYADGSNINHGYLYNRSTATYTTIDVPGASGTYVTNMTGNSVVGYYVFGGRAFGYVYRISTATFTALAPPGTSSTSANGVSGNFVFGFYADGSNINHGYLYNTLTATYTTFNAPGAVNTYVASGASGSNIAGTYVDAGGVNRAFLYELPPVQSDFTPSVNWQATVIGTPTVSVQFVSQTASGSTWEIVGNATYASAGLLTPTVTVTDASGNSLQTNDVSLDIFAPSQTTLTDTTPVATLNAVAGESTGNIVLASFSDAIPQSGLMTVLNVVGASDTYVTAVSGNYAMGVYTAGGRDFGFLYNISAGWYLGLAPPGASSTEANGLIGNDVVGFYADGSNINHGFLYDIGTGTYTVFDPPGSSNSYVISTSGNDVIGYYVSGGVAHGYVYDITTATYTTLAPPGTSSTLADGRTGNYIVGYYADGSNVNHGYLYNTLTATYTILDPAGSSNTYVLTASGNDIIGYYTLGGVDHGFVYDITTAAYMTLTPPGASSTLANGRSGNSIVGFYADGSNINHGYMYNVLTAAYTTFDLPGSVNTYPAAGASGGNIVGTYFDNGAAHGFLYQVAPVQSDFSASVNWGGAVVGSPDVSVQLVSQTATGSTWNVVGSATYAKAGSNTVNVTINDSDGNSVSADQTTINISRQSTVSTVAASASTSTYGDQVTFTAAVSPESNGIPTGTEVFYEVDSNGTVISVLGTSSLDSNGIATFQDAAFPAGTHYIAAAYNGDDTFAASALSGFAALTITRKALLATIIADDKIYDGTTAVVDHATLAGIVGTDSVVLVDGAATFASKNVGTQTVTDSGITLAGAAAANYTVNSSATATATITPRALTVSATAANKVYDGTNVALVTLSDDRVAGDDLTVTDTAATFSDENAGTDKTVTVTGISVSGTDAGNYVLASTSVTTTADITAKELTATGSTQGSINISKAGYITFAISNVSGQVDGDSRSTYQLFNGATFTLQVGANTYSVTSAASVDTSTGTIYVSWKMSSQLYNDLVALLGTSTSPSTKQLIDLIVVGYSYDGNYEITANCMAQIFSAGKITWS